MATLLLNIFTSLSLLFLNLAMFGCILGLFAIIIAVCSWFIEILTGKENSLSRVFKSWKQSY